MLVTLDTKRRITIPRALVPARPGDQFDATFDAEEGTITLRRMKGGGKWLEILKKCPVPMDDLPTRSRQMPKKVRL